jgi:hypothetical protein
MCVWAVGNGNGLSEDDINEKMKYLRMRLHFWAAPTPAVTLTYESKSFLDISKYELLRIIKIRKDEDSEAKDFLSNIKDDTKKIISIKQSFSNFFKKVNS